MVVDSVALESLNVGERRGDGRRVSVYNRTRRNGVNNEGGRIEFTAASFMNDTVK